MLTTGDAMVVAILEIAELVGKDYMRQHFDDAVKSELAEPDNDYPYFIGFESDDRKNLWTVFAYVSVDRTTKRVTILDYHLPDGTRMENPIKPVRLAAV